MLKQQYLFWNWQVWLCKIYLWSLLIKLFTLRVILFRVK